MLARHREHALFLSPRPFDGTTCLGLRVHICLNRRPPVSTLYSRTRGAGIPVSFSAPYPVTRASLKQSPCGTRCQQESPIPAPAWARNHGRKFEWPEGIMQIRVLRVWSSPSESAWEPCGPRLLCPRGARLLSPPVFTARHLPLPGCRALPSPVTRAALCTKLPYEPGRVHSRSTVAGGAGWALGRTLSLSVQLREARSTAPSQEASCWGLVSLEGGTPPGDLPLHFRRGGWSGWTPEAQ